MMDPTLDPAVPSRPARVGEVERHLREGIRSGRYAVGSRLPTEAELTRTLGVSRTVLREAVSALRAEGLLLPRQGAGVFVTRARSEPSPLSLLTDASETIADVIEELELRTAVEIEAAGLAASRASPAQLAAIQTAHEEFGRAANDGKATERPDAKFHRTIASATNNRRFEAFLTHLGGRTIPRAQLRERLGASMPGIADTLPGTVGDADLHAEHHRIMRAIVERDVSGAQEAMRRHLGDSMKRYRRMIHG